MDFVSILRLARLFLIEGGQCANSFHECDRKLDDIRNVVVFVKAIVSFILKFLRRSIATTSG